MTGSSSGRVFDLGFFKNMSDSAINFSQYRRFSNQPRGRVIAYLLLIVLVLGTPVLLSLAYDFNRDMNSWISDFSKTAPEFVLKNGELSVSGELPLVIEKEVEDEKSIIVVDTSGQTDESILKDYQSGIFISKTKAVYKQNLVETQEYHFAGFKGAEIQKADVEKALSYMKLVSILIVLFGLIYFFLAKLCTAALLGLVCLLFSRFLNAGLKYGQAFNITVYALTIPTLFQALQTIIAPGFAYGWSIYYTIALLYLWFAVRNIRIQQHESDGDHLA